MENIAGFGAVAFEAGTFVEFQVQDVWIDIALWGEILYAIR